MAPTTTSKSYTKGLLLGRILFVIMLNVLRAVIVSLIFQVVICALIYQLPVPNPFIIDSLVKLPGSNATWVGAHRFGRSLIVIETFDPSTVSDVGMMFWLDGKRVVPRGSRMDRMTSVTLPRWAASSIDPSLFHVHEHIWTLGVGFPFRCVVVTKGEDWALQSRPWKRGVDALTCNNRSLHIDLHGLIINIITTSVALGGLLFAIGSGKRLLYGLQNRCKHCGYARRGLEASRCPECGQCFDRVAIKADS